MYYKISANYKNCTGGFIDECKSKGLYEVCLKGNPDVSDDFTDENGVLYSVRRSLYFNKLKVGDICFCKIDETIWSFTITGFNPHPDENISSKHYTKAFKRKWNIPEDVPQVPVDPTIRHIIGVWRHECSWDELDEEYKKRQYMTNLNTVFPLDCNILPNA